MNVFQQYAPFVQDYIYRSGWDSLRAVQVAAGEAIFGTDDNVLLTAATASGKTEAAFFPVLTLLSKDAPCSIGAVYIGPLKALINDQFSRLEELCGEAGIPVWHWHGDVAQSHKARMLKHPSGVLQITPESLEAMLMRKHADIPRLFGDLRFIVIDEVHSVMRGDRGGQTLCLIERLCSLAGVNPRRIGLSATIGEPEEMGRLLSQGTGRRTVIPRLENKGVRWRLSMEHFFTAGPQAAEPEKKNSAQNTLEAAQTGRLCADSQRLHISTEESSPLPAGITAAQGERLEAEFTADRTDTAPAGADPGIGYIFEHTRGRKCLVFVNSREECETVTTTLRQYCEYKHEADRFLIHHGNLSASYRETAEEAMKDETRALTTVTTATLELGIDIGRLERAFQINAPFTVSSFLQRMGRTGRRELPPEMRFVMREEPPEMRASLPASLPWQLLQGAALVQLYREEHWVEPPRLGKLPYSLLYHQTMSVLCSCGELLPSQLARRVLSLSCFSGITKEDYVVLLRHLLATDQIQKTAEGGLIIGISGERQVNSYRFFAVFQENEEYTVRSGSQELGTVVKPPPVEERLALAGHVWVVDEIDHKRRTVYCTMVKGRVPAFFGLCPGDINTRVLERMKQVLLEDELYPYLMKNARARLTQARRAAHNAGLSSPLICLGGDSWCLMPWLGTYAFMALERLIKLKCAEAGIKGFESSKPYFMQFRMTAEPNEFLHLLAKKAAELVNPMELLYPGEVPVFEKYDEFVPEELVRKGFACGVLDINGMKERVLQWDSEIFHV